MKAIQLEVRAMSPGFRSAGVRSGEGLDLDPFLNLDLFQMSAPTFPPHPHAGFSAVTYMLPESEGSFVNRDSLGDQRRITPGAIHWTQAGAGMMHEEVPVRSGTECRGFQIFVDMRDKDRAPIAFHADAAAIPVIEREAATIRVVAGEFDGRTSPLRDLATPVRMLDITLSPAAHLVIDVAPGRNAFVFGIAGEVRCEGATIQGPGLLRFEEGARRVLLEAGAGARWRGLFCCGEPLRQAVVWGGPFAMTSREQLDEARRRFRRGEMGHLAPSF